MKRYETRVHEGVLYLETDEGEARIGSMDDVCALIGGEQYEVEYDDDQRSVPWLDTDEDGVLTIDVRETLADLSFDAAFVDNVVAVDPDDTTADGDPLRAAVFADMLTSIWDAKGNLDE